jgi:hypothetical protein
MKSTGRKGKAGRERGNVVSKRLAASDKSRGSPRLAHGLLCPLLPQAVTLVGLLSSLPHIVIYCPRASFVLYHRRRDKMQSIYMNGRSESPQH